MDVRLRRRLQALESCISMLGASPAPCPAVAFAPQPKLAPRLRIVPILALLMASSSLTHEQDSDECGGECRSDQGQWCQHIHVDENNGRKKASFSCEGCGWNRYGVAPHGGSSSSEQHCTACPPLTFTAAESNPTEAGCIADLGVRRDAGAAGMAAAWCQCICLDEIFEPTAPGEPWPVFTFVGVDQNTRALVDVDNCSECTPNICEERLQRGKVCMGLDFRNEYLHAECRPNRTQATSVVADKADMIVSVSHAFTGWSWQPILFVSIPLPHLAYTSRRHH
mmetsp:Transcript_87593/g.227389  ORF Transcript_87593/g.227389 Transcript_87593/m.227389 type:complete len:281 (-) Transcript_87593:114-956(-)